MFCFFTAKPVVFFVSSDLAVYDDRALGEQPRYLIHCKTLWSHSIGLHSSNNSFGSSATSRRYEMFPPSCPEAKQCAHLGLNHDDSEHNLLYTLDCVCQSRIVKTLLQVWSQIYFTECMFDVIKFCQVYTVCKIICIGFKGWIWILQNFIPLLVFAIL